jgi:tellurite resistance protein TerC
MIKTLQQAKRVIRIVIGFTVLLAGLAMTVLPGPAIVVIPAGLAILATEFLWARRLLDRIKQGASNAFNRTNRH